MSSWRVKVWRKVFNLKFVDSILRRRADELVNKLDVLKHLTAGGTYLDIGTGSGHNIVRILLAGRELEIRYIALDPSAPPTLRVMRRVRKNLAGRVLFLRGDGMQLPLADQSVDGVSIFFVLHHIPSDGQVKVLNEVRRVLKPGGKLMMWEDTPENPQEYRFTEKRDRRLNFESKSEGHWYRSGEDWRKLMSEMGFIVANEAYVEEHSRWPGEGTTRHRGFVFQLDHDR
jgi:ubiquinone/menaquinone biosynthesis C-methylase UbiE